jgi:ABC-type polysaccharide/polyol phosphate transport system ATPase subunit
MIAIKVENLTKVYHLFNSPTDRIKEGLHPLRKKYHNDFYALKGISCEIRNGETVCIVGRNGSGKSTLLKIIAGVLTPTSGHLNVYGKVSALLELGAGFNSQFTGIENIFFTGALQGYRKAEIEDRLDDILSFADIGEFIHQPVKTYSSGMYVRLAFAVAVNVDPDILIIDEVLAVVDAKFQLKCINKMKSFQDNGKTILIVTHSIDVMKTFATQGILINEGNLVYQGEPVETSLQYYQLLFPQAQYQQEMHQNVETSRTENKPVDEIGIDSEPNAKVNQHTLEVIPEPDARSYGVGGIRIDWIRIYGIQEPNIFRGGDTIRFDISYSWDRERIQHIANMHNVECQLQFGIRFENEKSVVLTDVVTTLLPSNEAISINPVQDGRSSCILSYAIDMPYLQNGDYFLSPGIAMGRQENQVVLKEYVYLINLNCISHQSAVYGLMNWNFQIHQID